jgi:hypothetical protein
MAKNRSSGLRCLSFLVSLIFCSLVSVHAQATDEILDQKTSFFPHAEDPVAQLLEIGSRFGIPMAIEWLEQSEELRNPWADKTAEGSSHTVRELITAVIDRSPGHIARIEDGFLRVYLPGVETSRRNLLNIRLARFSVSGEHLFGAENSLRLSINITLFPEKYLNGYTDSYGYPPDHPFTIKNVSFDGHGRSVRKVLNGLARANGNSTWIVHLKESDFTGRRPFWRRRDYDKNEPFGVGARLRFEPLLELNDLAEEELVLEYDIGGFGKDRFAVPVLMRERISASGTGRAGGNSDGHYGVGLDVNKILDDKIECSVQVTYKRIGEADTAMQEKFSVSRGQTIERQVRPYIRLKISLKKKQREQ